MYAVIEMTANRSNPKGYGVFVRLHRLVMRGRFKTAYNEACSLLSVDQLKTIYTMGVTGATNLLMASGDMLDDGEVQLFSEFQSHRRIWIFEIDPKSNE